MTPTSTSPPLPTIPDDVRAFAAERGAAEYVEPLLELARQCFPGAPLSIFLEEDLVIEGLWFIVIEVDVTDIAHPPTATHQGHERPCAPLCLNVAVRALGAQVHAMSGQRPDIVIIAP